jgi:formylglycine-generating enzyme
MEKSPIFHQMREPRGALLAIVAVAVLVNSSRTFLMRSAFVACVILAGSFLTSVRADSFGSGLNAFDIEFVTIGDLGNPDDTVTFPAVPVGGVPYAYRMGKYEISEQMISNANAMASLGITKDTRGLDKPATRMSWNEAARFVNWLNTSTGHLPAYKFAIQPDEPGYNSNANIQLWTPTDPGYNADNLYRNGLAKYFLPSMDEWYKAAYYEPSSGVYHFYPNGSNTAPTAVASGTAANTAVYNQPNFSGPAYITLAGGLSPYGTMAQGGNAYEWEETDYDRLNDSPTADRGIRGGDWDSTPFSMHAGIRASFPPSANSVGFRVASTIPEPGTVLLVGFAALGLLARHQRPCI